MRESSSNDLIRISARTSLIGDVVNVLWSTKYFCTTEPQKFVQSRNLPDLDIYCEKPVEVCKQLNRFISGLRGQSTKVKKLSGDHLQIFVSVDTQTIGVVDIHGPQTFRALGVRESMLCDLLDNYSLNGGSTQLKELDKVGLAAVRYLDYVQKFWDGRDKLRHVDWILSTLTRDQVSTVFDLMFKHGTGLALRSRKQGLRDLLSGLAIFWSPGWLLRYVGRIKSRVFAQIGRRG